MDALINRLRRFDAANVDEIKIYGRDAVQIVALYGAAQKLALLNEDIDHESVSHAALREICRDECTDALQAMGRTW